MAQGGIPAFRPGGSGRVPFLCAVLLGIGIAASTVLLVLHLRERALTTSGRELERIALMLAHQAERSLQAVDLVQSSILERLADVHSVEQYGQNLTGIAFHQDLQARIRGLPQVEAIGVIGADGTVLNFSRSWPAPDIKLADRDYFKALRDDSQRETFISEPIRARATGTWTFYLGRRIAAPDGTFLGVIFAALDLSHFERLYAETGFGDDSFVSLWRQDGTLLARHPHYEPGIGRSLFAGSLFPSILASPPRAALVRFNGQIDSANEKLVAIRMLSNYPLAINVGINLRSALAEWRKQAAYLGASGCLLELVIIGIGALILRQVRSQRLLVAATAAQGRAEAALALAREERAQDEARIKDARFGAALDNMSQGLGMFDTEQRLVVANPRFMAFWGLPGEMAPLGALYAEVVDHAVARGVLDPAEGAAIKANATARRHIGKRASYVREMKDGRSVAVCMSPIDSGGWLATYEDISERRQAEAQIAYMAHHDALTGLPNRVLFRQRLQEAVTRSHRDETFAVLCLDLDRFKAVNDTLGHPVGDALLRAVTGRLLHHVRETDTVARLGGDEFAVIQGGIDQPADATTLSRRLVDALGAPYEINGHCIIIGTSIGIAMIPGDGTDADTLLKNADLALYRAKADGRGTYRFFEPGMDAAMQARRALEIDLRKALETGQFELFYQPILELRSREVSGFEALIRWRHPARGLVPPDAFIPLAEEVGLIVPIGEWVLKCACAEAASWPRALKVSVNLSSVQFSGAGPMTAVAAALKSSGLDPARLELEITETVMLEDTSATLDTLHALKALGVSIAMDDFGTGYSSLSYLRKFPFDRVKIDKSFIADLSESSESVAIVEAVTSLCKTLGMATTVEGVETEAQMEGLRLGSCTNVQGYLFSKPRPAGEVEQMCMQFGPVETAA